MQFKTEIIDLIDAHLVVRSLMRNDNSKFTNHITDKIIEVKVDNRPYLKIWFGEPVVIKFGRAVQWNKKPPKRFGVISIGGEWDKITKINKFDEFKNFFEVYVM